MLACRVLAALALVFSTAAVARAGEPTERLRTFFDRANRVILAPESEGGFDERVAAVRALVTEVFDVDGAAALALGRHWQALTPSARTTFTRLYADVVERGYLAWVGSKARVGQGGVAVGWIDEVVEGDTANVRSVLMTRAGGELPIDYRLVRRERGWLVRDVVVDGVSLAANYRVQFERVLQLGSYDELLARLRDKAGPAARQEAEAARASRLYAAAPSAAGRARDEMPPPTSRPAPRVAEIRDARDVASDARDVVVRDARDGVIRDARDGAIHAAHDGAIHDARDGVIRDVRDGDVRDGRDVIGGDARLSASIPSPPTVDEAPPRTASAVASAATAGTPVVSSPASSGAREFWVQVGAFRTIDAASQLVRRLRDRAVTIAVAGERPATLTRVLVGPFAERSAAASAVRALHAGGFAAFIAE
jgi:phospholipid transport system substrate-binding protein